jgi:phospholipid transport system substrate-binding protein
VTINATSHMPTAARLAAALVSLGCVFGPVDARAEEGPRTVVERVTNAAIAVLGDKSLGVDDKRHRLEEIIYREVDFDTMSRLVLARNWSRFTPEQQAEFVKLYKEHLSVTYGNNIENYKNERVAIVGDREEARGDWTVQSKIVRGGGSSDIQVDYRLRKAGDAWKVIDIVIERVSLVANFRSQFQDILGNGTPDKLLAVLREKNARHEPLKPDEGK